MLVAPWARFGAYEVIAKFGEGGMGEVYRAHIPRLKRDAARARARTYEAGDVGKATQGLKVVPEFGVRDQRGDFEPLISAETSTKPSNARNSPEMSLRERITGARF